MNDATTRILLYYAPLSFPCGAQSTCCGPVGQTEDELRGYVAELSRSFPDVPVTLIDTSQKLRLPRDGAALKLISSFGRSVCPIFAVNGDVISMGPPAMPELLALLRDKLQSKV